MTVNYTTNLALGQPVTGTESGTWGDDVNNAVTSYLDIAIAGGLSIAITTADVTLTLTQGTSAATNIGSTTAQYAILNITGAKTAARNLNVPASSRHYIINNSAATGGFLLTVRGVTPTTGITLVDGEKAIIAWNGSDYVKIASSVISNVMGFTTTATAAGTTTLTNTSTYYQLFTGATTQTIVLPVVTTLALGWTFHIANNSTGVLTVNSSGGNLVISVPAGVTTMCTCILITGTTAASWEAGLTDFSTVTGTGAVVLGTSPTIATPAITFSTSATVTAGTNAQGQGALTNDYNVITTAATNPSGVTLPTATVGRRVIVVNKGANPINIYPATGGAIDALAANAAIPLPVGSTIEFDASTTTQWYSTYNAYTTLQGFATTATAAGTTTLTSLSGYEQYFTGTTTQTVVLPVVTTLALGRTYTIVNNSTGNITVNSSGANLVITVLPGTTAKCTCTLITGTTAASWEAGFTNFSTATGTGAVVLGTSPTIATATLTGANTIQGLTVGLGAGAVADNTAVGVSALLANTTGTGNTALGNESLKTNTTGYGNTAVGSLALKNNTANSLTAVGSAALSSNTTGVQNTAVGNGALFTNLTGGYNTAVGYSALVYNTANSNTALGNETLANNASGTSNTAVGQGALLYNQNSYNTGVGANALSANVSGSKNIGIGYNSGNGITTGSNNVVIGNYSGFAAPISETGSNWIVLSDGDGDIRQAMDATSVQFLTGATVVYAPAPATTISAVTTLTNAQILPQIVVTSGTSFTLTMPLGTTLETLISWAGVDLGFDFSVINTASGTITMAVNTGVTSVGTLTVLTGISARFRIRRTAASTFVMYRI